jgi:hypothetical protein
MATEQQVQIAAKMYETRDAMKRLRGDKWTADFRELSGFIRRAMEQWGIGELSASLRLCQTKELEHEPLTHMMLVAAAVEMVEPSEAGD